MLLSEWRKTAPNRECMSNKVFAVLKPVLTDLGADDDPACWVLWGEDPEFRYSIMAPTTAGVISVAVRVSGGAEGPRATGKLVRWGKLSVSELGVEGSGGHRIVAVQVEGQVLKGTDDEADQICEFVLGLLAGIDGRAYTAAGPVVVEAMPQVVAVARPAVVKPEAPKAGAKPGLKAVPAPAAAPAAASAAASGAGEEAASEAAEEAPPAAEQPPARKPAKTPGGKTRAAWVAPHPIGLPAPRTPTPIVAPPPAKPEAPKPPAVPAAHPAAAARSGEPEGGQVWDVPEPSEREAKRPRTWTP